MNLRDFFRELKKRKVYQVAITYGITAWLLAQVMSLVADTFKAPDWVMQVFLVILILGFPISLILAWAYELSPEGVIRTDSSKSEENPYPQTKRRPLANTTIIGLLILAIAYLLISRGGFFSQNSDMVTGTISSPNSIPIAMLPLINLSEDKQLGYVSSQVTNDIINELAKVRSFAVTAFSTIYNYEDQGKSPTDIAEELSVNYLMRGSARAYSGGDSIKIDVELIDPLTGRLLWNESYQEIMGEAPALQSAIARKVAAQLNVRLSPSESESLSGKRTEIGGAYLKFLQARQEFLSLEIPRMKHAVTLLEEAIELDPNYAEAHTLLAWALTMFSWPAFKTNETALKRNKDRIESHLQTAIRLNAVSSDIYLVQANYALSYLDDLKEAKDLVEKAIELNSWPELPTSLCICTAVTVNVVKGELDRAKEIAGIAGKVEPGNIMIINDAFLMDLVEEDMRGASKNIERALQLMDVPVFRYQTGWAYYHEGRYKEAIELLLKAYEGQGYTTPTTLAYLSNSYYELGDLERSNAYKDSLEERLSAGEKNVLVDLATIAAIRGQDEQTITYLERHRDESVIGMSYQLNVDPAFRKYEANPRYIALRREMGYYD